MKTETVVTLVTSISALCSDLLISALPKQDIEIMQVDSRGYAFKSDAIVLILVEFIQNPVI